MNSEYIVYVDESGDHSMTRIDPEYPVFALSFCILRKDHYCTDATPAMRSLKFRHFGHDMVVLHEMEIRRRKGVFAAMGKDVRDALLADLSSVTQRRTSRSLPS